MKNIVFLCIVICLYFISFSQVNLKPQVPNTYALIVGVGHYKNPQYYNTLKYSVSDGRHFYNYLLKSNYGQTKRENIDTLYNENATSSAIITKLSSLKNKLKDGDLLYFYFSGHGDANEEGAYLLAYDAPNNSDKNNYNGAAGVIDIYMIKRIISNITSKNVKFVLITDACRTNELAGGQEGQNSFGKAIEQDAGEMRFTSCKTNQFSYEGPQWGNGRSVFSYHLINGLLGLADSNDDENDVVDFNELRAYVNRKVKEDTQNQSIQQTPQFYCNDENFVDCEAYKLNHFKKGDKEQLLAILNNQIKNVDIAAVGKGVDLEKEIAKFGKRELYDEFINLLNEGKLIGENSAKQKFDELMNDANVPENIKIEINDKYSVYLGNSVNNVVNEYLAGTRQRRLYSKEYFLDAYDKINLFKEISSTYEFDKEKIDANAYFFKGHSYFLEQQVNKINTGLEYLDSALALNPNAAYIYNAKAVLSTRFSHYNDLFQDLRKAKSLAPGWPTPVNNIAYMYFSLDQLDSALFYNTMAIEMGTSLSAPYTLRATIMYEMNEKDSAKFYLNKALSVDALDYDANLLNAKWSLDEKDYTNAKKKYLKLEQLNPDYFDAYAGMIEIEIQEKGDDIRQDTLQYYMQKIINSDEENAGTYNYLADLLLNYNLNELAKDYYNYAYAIDDKNLETYLGIGKVYQNLFREANEGKEVLDYSMLDTSFSIYYYTTLMDPLNDLCFYYLGTSAFYLRDTELKDMGEITKSCFSSFVIANGLSDDITFKDLAIYCFEKAYQLNPLGKYNSDYLAYCYKTKNNFAKAAEYYHEHFKLYRPYTDNYIEYIECLAQIKEFDLACSYIEKGISAGALAMNYKDLKNREKLLLKPLKKSKTYKTIMKSLKKNEK